MKREFGTDDIDRILDQWSVERPDLDVSAMGIFGRLSRAVKLLDISLAKTFVLYGLNGGEFDVLATLRRSGEPYSLTPTALYRSMMLSSAAMTNRIDRLEARSLVARGPDPKDRRGVKIRLTEEGLDLIEAAVKEHVEGQERLLAAMNRGDREHLAVLLSKLAFSIHSYQQSETESSDNAGNSLQ